MTAKTLVVGKHYIGVDGKEYILVPLDLQRDTAKILLYPNEVRREGSVQDVAAFLVGVK